MREFADLEGYIGAVYAEHAGESAEVAQAIEDQYLPDSAGGPLPAMRETQSNLNNPGSLERVKR